MIVVYGLAVVGALSVACFALLAVLLVADLIHDLRRRRQPGPLTGEVEEFLRMHAGGR